MKIKASATFSVPYRLSSGRLVRVRFDAGDHVPQHTTFGNENGKVETAYLAGEMMPERLDPPVAVSLAGVCVQLSEDLDQVEIQIGWRLKRMSPADARTLADAIVALADSVQK